MSRKRKAVEPPSVIATTAPRRTVKRTKTERGLAEEERSGNSSDDIPAITVIAEDGTNDTARRDELEDQLSDHQPARFFHPDRGESARALTADELQSANYMNEMMSYGVRNFATGWLLQDTSMTLWYADRMGLVQSTAFDIFKEPHLLLLLVAALFHADHHKLGLSPLLSFPQRRKKAFSDYNGMKMRLYRCQSEW